MSMIQQAMENVPKWLLPSVVVVVLGLAFWNQNNERRFVVLEQATARNEERVASAVSLIGRIEQGLINTAAQHRAEDMAHTAQTRELIIEEFERQIEEINVKLTAIQRHLEATDGQLDSLREAVPRR